jgi:cell division protease FtsH
MPDTPNPQPDKTRKNRSFGAFLLFLTVLVAVLIVYGRDQFQNPRELTQDQYGYFLHRGLVEEQKIQGASKITGTLKFPQTLGNGQEFKEFKVNFLGLSTVEETFRELKAQPGYTEISSDEFLAGLGDGVYAPQRATLLMSTIDRPAPAAKAERSSEAAKREAAQDAGAAPRVETQRSELLVQVIAPSLADWQARQAAKASANPAEAAPQGAPYMLPPVAGVFPLYVKHPKDLSLVIAALGERGVKPELIKFDLVKGTVFAESSTIMTQVLFIWGPWILIFVVFLIFMRQMRSQGGAGGVMSFGRSRAQLYSKESHTNTTFDDVAGAQEAKDEVREVVEFLKNPSRFTKIGGRIPRGVLLVGPPGCGKTLLAKAIAGEAEVPFFSISGSDFVEMFVGVGASRVRDLFKQARENSPCIIFLDEIDAVGRRRGSGLGGGHDEREQTLNAILVEMDGFGTDEGIIVIAATNRPDVLDPALLRPGRFDREVVIDLPDMEGREEILRVHLKKVKCGPDADVKTLARSTPGYSGADLAAIINEAAIRAALARKDEISMDDLEEARDKVRYGRQKRSRKLELEDRRITAYHESGHAIVAATIPEVDNPHKVTIVPRGRSLGATMILPDRESYHMQKKRMVGMLAWMFGGRVAESEFCGDISAGAADDIKKATDLARAMVTELGMSERIGPVNYSERQGSDFLGTELMRGRTHSEETAREIDQEVHLLLEEAYQRAVAIVRERRDGLERIAQALLAFETVSGEEVDRLLAGATAQTLRPGAPAILAPPVGEVKKAASVSKPAHGDGRTGDLPGKAGLSPA